MVLTTRQRQHNLSFKFWHFLTDNIGIVHHTPFKCYGLPTKAICLEEVSISLSLLSHLDKLAPLAGREMLTVLRPDHYSHLSSGSVTLFCHFHKLSLSLSLHLNKLARLTVRETLTSASNRVFLLATSTTTQLADYYQLIHNHITSISRINNETTLNLFPLLPCARPNLLLILLLYYWTSQIQIWYGQCCTVQLYIVEICIHILSALLLQSWLLHFRSTQMNLNKKRPQQEDFSNINKDVEIVVD